MGYMEVTGEPAESESEIIRNHFLGAVTKISWPNNVS